MKPKSGNNFWGGIICVIAGVGIVVLGGWLIHKHMLIATFPSVFGKAIDFPANDEIRYSYKVDGKEYIGLRIAFATDDAESFLVADKKVGDRLQVWYNPSAPAEAYLVKNSIREAIIGPIFCICFGLFLVVGPVYELRRQRRSETTINNEPTLS